MSIILYDIDINIERSSSGSHHTNIVGDWNITPIGNNISFTCLSQCGRGVCYKEPSLLRYNHGTTAFWLSDISSEMLELVKCERVNRHYLLISRCIKIALVHDMAECIVGDITPMDGITKEEKNKLEEVSTMLYVNIWNVRT